MDAGRVLADEQLLGDLAVGPALDQERQDVALAPRQPERIVRRGGGAAGRLAAAVLV